MPHILHIITGLRAGGAETMLYRLAGGLKREGLEQTVISLSERAIFNDRIEAMGIPVFSLNIKSGVSLAVGFYRLILLIRALKPDLIHTWMYHADLLGGMAAKLVGLKSIIWSIHHSNLDGDKNKRTTLILARINALLSRIIPTTIVSCSRQAIDAHVRFGYVASKFQFIPNGFDISLFKSEAVKRREFRSQLGLKDEDSLIGLVARFDPLKNHAGFIAAASLISKSNPQVYFLMAGDGVNHGNTALTGRIEQAGLAGQVRLLGLCENMPVLMASLDILVSASLGEAFPMVIGEAMACGVPCVVTDVGDSRFLVADTGRVVAANDAAAIAQACRDLLALPRQEKERLGQAARERIGDHFSLERVTAEYQQLYQALIS